VTGTQSIRRRFVSPERTSDVILLVVETNTGDAGEELFLRRAVSDTLGLDDSGRPWYVERLFPATGPEPDALDRYFRVSGSVDAPPQRFEQAAFELAYRLSDATGFHVEPDLPSSSFAPPEPDFAEALGPERTLHLPGSEPRDWALDTIRCREAWELPPGPGGTTHGEGTVIAHPDTGYTDHPDAGVAAFDLRRDRDLLGNDDDASDPLDTWRARPFVNPGHGTSTASVLAGRLVTNIEGVAPRATVVPLRTIKSVVQVFDSDVARAVDYARRIGAHVVSMSLGGTGFLGLREAIDHAVAEGLIVLAAAGNEVRFIVAPAIYPNCIAVAATNAEDRPWSGSSRGAKVAVSAPGESVWVATYRFEPPSGPRPVLRRHHGTSFAVAHTAGAAALWIAHHGREALIERYGRSRLQSVFLHLVATHGHRRPEGWDHRNFGVGLLDAQALLAAPLPAPADVEDVVPELAPEAVAAAPAGERVAALFPDLTADEVDARLAALFGARGDALSARLDRYEAELVRMFSERPEAWEAFMAAAVDGARPPEATAAATAASDVALTSAVAQFGSPTLILDARTGRRP
jgi:subtilisin family serine protease